MRTKKEAKLLAKRIGNRISSQVTKLERRNHSYSSYETTPTCVAVHVFLFDLPHDVRENILDFIESQPDIDFGKNTHIDVERSHPNYGTCNIWFEEPSMDITITG